MNVPPQIEQMTMKVESFMAKYPKLTFKDTFDDIGKASGYPSAWFFVVAVLLLTGILTLIGGAKLIIDLLGFIYPAYMSFKSMDTTTDASTGDDVQWLTYWICISFISIVESMFSFLTNFIPMYFWLKIGLIVWMWYPSTRGAQTVYDQVLRPILLPYIKPDETTTKKTE